MRYINLIVFILIFICSNTMAYEADIIMDIKKSKTSIYRDSGIFHNGIKDTKSTLMNLRHSGKNINSFERIVFDFEGKELPQVYAHINQNTKKLQIDFLSTKLSKDIKPMFKSHRVLEVNFFPLANDVLSTEVLIKENTYVEIFSLDNPTRLVVDFKN